MKSKALQGIITAGLLICPALAQEVVSNSFLTVDMKCYFQESGTPTATVGAWKVGVYRVGTKQLLQLAGNQLGFKFPGGTKLSVDSAGNVFAVKSDGTVLANLSEFFNVKRDTGKLLFDGRSKQPTGKQTSTNYYPATLNFKVSGLIGKVSGIQIETFSITAPDDFGIRRLTSDSKTDVNGKGNYANSLSYYVGEMKLNGKSALIKN